MGAKGWKKPLVSIHTFATEIKTSSTVAINLPHELPTPRLPGMWKLDELVGTSGLLSLPAWQSSLR